MLKFIMQNKFIACKLETRKEGKTAGGIILPQQEMDKNTQVYRVIAVPNNEECAGYKVGDRVLLDQNTYSNLKANVDGEDIEFTYISPENILCIVRDGYY